MRSSFSSFKRHFVWGVTCGSFEAASGPWLWQMLFNDLCSMKRWLWRYVKIPNVKIPNVKSRKLSALQFFFRRTSRLISMSQVCCHLGTLGRLVFPISHWSDKTKQQREIDWRDFLSYSRFNACRSHWLSKVWGFLLAINNSSLTKDLWLKLGEHLVIRTDYNRQMNAMGQRKRQIS